MRTNLGIKHYLYPQPVLLIATYNEDGSPNVMNAAWGCVADTDKIAIVIAHNHKTTENILRNKDFTISMATKKYVTEADYVGVVSGLKEPNKMEKVHWHYLKSEFVNAPIIEELPLSIECTLYDYDLETEIMLCEIKNTSIDDAYLKDGKLDVSKMEIICYDGANHTYLTLGEKVGNAFKDGFNLK